jgi:copper resistance protein B
VKAWVMILFFLAFLPVTGPAADVSHMDSEKHKFPADNHEVGAGPEKEGQEIRKYADDAQTGALENFGFQPMHDNEIFAVFLADRLEYQVKEREDTLLWDLQAWLGSDYNKLWFKSEGVWMFDKERAEEAQVELLYSRNVTTFWDLQVGIRHDFKPEPIRTFAALGVQGLAPFWFEVEATAYISDDGDISAVLETEYDLLLTQRLILQPRFETSIAVQEVEKYGVGQGINDIELGVRLRYEIRREFAPYIGISWSRKIGETADLAEDDGEDIDATAFVIGIKVWF